MPTDSTPAILAAMTTVQTGIDDLRSRMDGTVTRAELLADMRQITARLDHIHQAILTERSERIAQISSEQDKRETAIDALRREVLAELHAEQRARLESQHEAQTRFWRVIGIVIPALALLLTISEYFTDHFFS